MPAGIFGRPLRPITTGSGPARAWAGCGIRATACAEGSSPAAVGSRSPSQQTAAARLEGRRVMSLPRKEMLWGEGCHVAMYAFGRCGCITVYVLSVT